MAVNNLLIRPYLLGGGGSFGGGGATSKIPQFYQIPSKLQPFPLWKKSQEKRPRMSISKGLAESAVVAKVISPGWWRHWCIGIIIRCVWMIRVYSVQLMYVNDCLFFSTDVDVVTQAMYQVLVLCWHFVMSVLTSTQCRYWLAKLGDEPSCSQTNRIASGLPMFSSAILHQTTKDSTLIFMSALTWNKQWRMSRSSRIKRLFRIIILQKICEHISKFPDSTTLLFAQPTKHIHLPKTTYFFSHWYQPPKIPNLGCNGRTPLKGDLQRDGGVLEAMRRGGHRRGFPPFGVLLPKKKHQEDSKCLFKAAFFFQPNKHNGV